MNTEDRSSIGAEGRKRPLGTAPVETPTAAEAKEEATALPGPENDRTGAGGILPNHEFDLDYKDDRGRVWRGHFACHALTYREKVQVGLTRARMAGHVPPSALDSVTAQLLEMMAHLTVAIDKAPDWAAKIEDVYDAGVVGAIYTEVAQHEARFHGARASETGAGSR